MQYSIYIDSSTCFKNTVLTFQSKYALKVNNYILKNKIGCFSKEEQLDLILLSHLINIINKVDKEVFDTEDFSDSLPKSKILEVINYLNLNL